MSSPPATRPDADPDPDPDGVADPGTPARWYRPAAPIIGLYLLLALWITSAWWAGAGRVDPAENTSDPAFFEWVLGHAVRVFTAGEHPLASPGLNAPAGVNLMANTGLLGLTVPFVPVTALLGPARALVLLVTLGLAGTATAWYLTLRRYLVRTPLAAAVGGGFCGFAPGMVNHANAHPNLVAQFLIPIILFRALELRRPGPAPRRGVVLGLLITWQALINEELLFLYALTAGVFVLFCLVQRPALARHAARPMAAGLAVAALVAGALLGYPVAYQFFGPQSYRGLPEFVLGYGTDLAAFAALPKLSLGGGAGDLGPLPEENTYFGPLLLLVALAVVIGLGRRYGVRALAGTGLLVAVLALGSTARYQHRTLLDHAPWGLLNQLPLVDSVVPIRLGLLLIPVLGVLLALGLDAVWALPAYRLWPRAAAVAAVGLALIPLLPARLPVVPRPPVPVFVSSGDWRRYLPPGRALLSADSTVWNGGITVMRWATAAGQQFPVVGGYFLGPDWTGRGGYGAVPRTTSSLLGGIVGGTAPPAVTPELRAAVRADLRYWRVGVVVLAPGTGHAEQLQTTLDGLLGPGQAVDDVVLWTVNDQ